MTSLKTNSIACCALIISSCANVSFKPSNFENYVNLVQSTASTTKNLILQKSEFILSDSEFSRIVVSQNNKPYITMTLRKFDQYDEWLSSDDILLYTLNGKVTASSSFANDLRTINPPDIKKIFQTPWKNNKKYHYSYISFSNPKTELLSLRLEYEFLEKTFITLIGSDQPKEVYLFSELFFLDSIKWKDKNFYWVDENGVVLRSKQHISPKNKLRIDYIY